MTNLTLEERSKFESLLAEYANAEMDCVRATGRVHDALHAVEAWANERTKRVADESAKAAFGAPSGMIVPTGTPPDATAVAEAMGALRAWTPDEIGKGFYHAVGPWVPVKNCSCRTCVEHRSNSRGGTTETEYGPLPMGQYSGN